MAYFFRVKIEFLRLLLHISSWEQPFTPRCYISAFPPISIFFIKNQYRIPTFKVQLSLFFWSEFISSDICILLLFIEKYQELEILLFESKNSPFVGIKSVKSVCTMNKPFPLFSSLFFILSSFLTIRQCPGCPLLQCNR